MILIDVESQNLPELIRLYKTIPYVVQVRCNKILRQHYKDFVGEDGLYVACLVQVKSGEDKYLKFEDILSKEMWDDPMQYQNCLQNMKLKIDDYIENDVLPKTPYSE
jgi:hypothetical protein